MSAVINSNNALQWLGRVDVRADHASPARMEALFATLDREDPAPANGDVLPPLGHWLYFVRPELLGEDGSGRGAFLPPIELPCRAWAESRLRFYRPLRVGDDISRMTSIVDIGETQGQGGPRVSVLVRDEIADADGVALSEEQRIVFSGRAKVIAGEPPYHARPAPTWSRIFHADARTLFRYAALTFDARRVHYDRPYATFVEGHPGLLVQDGLIAHLLLDLLRRHAPGVRIAACHVHAIRPLFDTEPVHLHGRPTGRHRAALWAENARGVIAMEATATLDDTLPG